MTALPALNMGPAANAFRKEVRDWLTKHWTPEKQAAHLHAEGVHSRVGVECGEGGHDTGPSM